MRTTLFQFQIIVDYMERYGDISRLRRYGMSTEKIDRHWEKLTGLLNRGIGPLRNDSQWKKVWSDFKKSTRKKDRKMKIAYNGPHKSKKGFLDARVMAIINNEYLPLLGESSETGDRDIDIDRELRPNELPHPDDNSQTVDMPDSDDTTSDDELVIDTKVDFSIQNYSVDNDNNNSGTNDANEINLFVSSYNEGIQSRKEEVIRENSSVQNNKDEDCKQYDMNNISQSLKENDSKSDETSGNKDATVKNEDQNSVPKEHLQTLSNVSNAGQCYEPETRKNRLNNFLEDIGQILNEIKQPPIILNKNKAKHAARNLPRNNSPNHLVNVILRAEIQKFNAANAVQSGAACNLLSKDEKTKDPKSSVTEKSGNTFSLTSTVAVDPINNTLVKLTNTNTNKTSQNNRDKSISQTSPSQQKDLMPDKVSKNHSNDDLMQNKLVNTSNKHNVNLSDQNCASTSAGNSDINSVTQNNEVSINVCGGNDNENGSKRRRSTINPAALTPNKRRRPYSMAPESEKDERQFQREVALLKLEIEKEEIRLKNKGFEVINRILSFTEKFCLQRFQNTI